MKGEEKMAKEIILYNLKGTVTDEEYKKYCEEKKGPFLSSLPSCKNFTLIKIVGSKKGQIPYKYVGVIDATSLQDWQKDASSEAFQNFLKEWIPKVADFHILFGEEVYGK
jgi:hypothetical protein